MHWLEVWGVVLLMHVKWALQHSIWRTTALNCSSWQLMSCDITPRAAACHEDWRVFSRLPQTFEWHPNIFPMQVEALPHVQSYRGPFWMVHCHILLEFSEKWLSMLSFTSNHGPGNKSLHMNMDASTTAWGFHMAKINITFVEFFKKEFSSEILQVCGSKR